MLHNIIEEAQMAVLNYALEEGVEVNGEMLGLDPRALHRGWATRGALIVQDGDDDRLLQHYGGFEYVEKRARTQVGRYVIYWRNEDERVDGALECAEQMLDLE